MVEYVIQHLSPLAPACWPIIVYPQFNYEPTLKEFVLQSRSVEMRRIPVLPDHVQVIYWSCHFWGPTLFHDIFFHPWKPRWYSYASNVLVPLHFTFVLSQKLQPTNVILQTTFNVPVTPDTYISPVTAFNIKHYTFEATTQTYHHGHTPMVSTKALPLNVWFDLNIFNVLNTKKNQ